MQLGWSCTKFSPHFEMPSHKMKPNKLMISASTVSPLSLIVFLKTLIWNIKISILHVCWILKFLIWQFIGWFKSDCNWWVPWWHEHFWIRCWPSIKSNRWIKRWSSWWVQSSVPPLLGDPRVGEPISGSPPDNGCELILFGCSNKTSLPWINNPLAIGMLIGGIVVVVDWTNTPLGIRTSCFNPKISILTKY